MEPVFRLTNAEAKLADLLWDNAPMASMEMVKLAGVELGWKKSTAFSVLKFLIGKGLAQNVGSVVSMLYSREQFVAQQGIRYIDEAYDGSLPLFVAAFTRNRKLTPEQLAELRSLIEDDGSGDKVG